MEWWNGRTGGDNGNEFVGWVKWCLEWLGGV